MLADLSCPGLGDEMNETTFENANVGDLVWSFQLGKWGTILEINNLGEKAIEVNFGPSYPHTCFFTLSGSWLEGENQVIFWDEIPFVAPPRPPRKVIKKVKRWLYICDDYEQIFTKEPHLIREGSPHERVVLLTGEYEVEE